MSTKENPAAGALRVDVRDLAGQPIADATVIVTALIGPGQRKPGTTKGKENEGAVKGKESRLKYDKNSRTYIAHDPTPGRYLISVSAGELEPQSRETVVQPAGTEELFILGKKGLPSYFRGKVRVPFDVDPDIIAITLQRNLSEQERKPILERIAKSHNLGLEETPELARRSRMQLLRLPRNAGAKGRREVLAKLRDNPQVEIAGAVINLGKSGFTMLKDEAVVCFKGHVTEEQAHKIVRQFDFSVIRHIPYSPNTFHLRAKEAGSIEMLGALDKLAQHQDVEWAEPNLVQSPELDTVTPPDVLWGGCWDRQRIGCGDAWQALQDAGLETYGDPGIIIGVIDSGTQSAAGVPTNPDFQGTVSDGSTKLYRAFDFNTMTPDNNNPWDTHGSGVAGVVSGRAANPAPVMGQSSGVAGSAPNCRILTVTARIPYVDVELADQMIWMAGFNPNSPLPGFPAPITPGVDVTTSSLGLGGGPLSGTGRAMIDFLTSFGRGGKGCLTFWSTGNGNANNVISRPYSAYEKSFGIAATTYANDGTTEIRAPYSGHGNIALCAPSHDNYPVFHNPNGSFATWGAGHAGQGNMISHRAIETTVSVASVGGANTLTLASAAGLAVGQVIHVGVIGAVGSEPARITAVNAMTNTITVNGWTTAGAWGGGLINAHGVGDPVAQGPADHINNFGGTSSATPLTAGVGALLLSAEPDLTWVEVRQILRDTAVKFDLANNDPVGRWLDAMGNPSNMSGQPPVRSGWYGYGRVDAAAAVQGAIAYGFTRDVVVRDNLADTGAVPSAGAFWNTPDVWVRNDSPMIEGGAALPANYMAAGPHLNPRAGQPNWVYARVRNNGTAPSLDCYIRISVTHFPGMQFTYPSSFIPTNRPGDPVPMPMTPGTYLIGEVKVSGILPGEEAIVNVEWPAAMIPPEDVMVGMTSVHWHPCLLVECSPLDGPSAGTHVWESNSLAQKNISIIYTDTDGSNDFAMGIVAGHEENMSEFLVLEIDRGYLPRNVRLYVDLVSPILKRRLREGFKPCGCKESDSCGDRGSVLTGRDGEGVKPYVIGHHEGREVVFLASRGKTRIPIYGGPGTLSPIVVGGIVGKGAAAGGYSVSLVQLDADGKQSGSAELAVTIKN